jgi:hypothetical protein
MAERDEKLQQYGFVQGMLDAFPELKSLFDKAVKGDWTQDKFQAELQKTNWYKTTSDTKRKAIALQYTDPATYGKLWHDTQMKMWDMAGQLGANADWNLINRVSGQIIFDGLTDDQARDVFGQYMVFGKSGLTGGEAGVAMTDIQTYMYSMGVQNSTQWLQDATREIVKGNKTTQDYKNDIMSQAVAAFPGFEKQLKAGQTMADLASPYMQTMSQILEIAPGSINMFDPAIRSAMSYKNKDGTSGTQPLWEFQNKLREDPRWKLTKNAQDATMGVAHKVLVDMGMAF